MSIYSEQYRKLVKKFGGNIVPTVLKALKNLESERDAEKKQKLVAPAIAALQKDINELKNYKGDYGGDAALFMKALIELQKEIENSKGEIAKALLEEAKGEEELESAKNADAIVDKIEKTAGEVKIALKHYSEKKTALWEAIKAFSDARWECISNFAKGYGVSPNGFRSFPMAIAIMEDECKSANEPGEKGVKGKTQTVGMHGGEKKDSKEKPKDDDKIGPKFVAYSRSEVANDLKFAVGAAEEVEKHAAKVRKDVAVVVAGVDKLHKMVGTGSGATQWKQVLGAGTKLKHASGFLASKSDAAEKSVGVLIKRLNKDAGLGTQDGDLRDGFDAIPDLEPKDLIAALKELETFTKVVVKKVSV